MAWVALGRSRLPVKVLLASPVGAGGSKRGVGPESLGVGTGILRGIKPRCVRCPVGLGPTKRGVCGAWWLLGGPWALQTCCARYFWLLLLGFFKRQEMSYVGYSGRIIFTKAQESKNMDTSSVKKTRFPLPETIGTKGGTQCRTALPKRRTEARRPAHDPSES